MINLNFDEAVTATTQPNDYALAQPNDYALAQPGASNWQPSGYTGIAGVDALLEPVLQHGGVILASGYTGSGKTCLAGQIAGCLTAAGKKVAYLRVSAD